MIFFARGRAVQVRDDDLIAQLARYQSWPAWRRWLWRHT